MNDATGTQQTQQIQRLILLCDLCSSSSYAGDDNLTNILNGTC